jgi:release factor glutamine methyltransferase
VLDIGTGSGCIAVALAHNLPAASVVAVDISEAALVVACRNAARHGAAIEFIRGSLLEPLTGRLFDLIVSNPPYIPSGDIETLQPEVREFDPRSALDGGLDGLEIYRRLIPQAASFLKCGGWLLVEVGAGQADDVSRLFSSSGEYGLPTTSCDSAGIVRVVGGQRS